MPMIPTRPLSDSGRGNQATVSLDKGHPYTHPTSAERYRNIATRRDKCVIGCVQRRGLARSPRRWLSESAVPAISFAGAVTTSGSSSGGQDELVADIHDRSMQEATGDGNA